MEGPSSSSNRRDRKTMEKNRRLQMKTLYTKLDSLLPHSKEEVPLLMDRLDKTTEYIQSLQEKLKVLKERKEYIIYRSGGTSSSALATMATPPHIEIHDLGPAMEVIVISSPSERFVFYDMVIVLEEEGVEVLNASFSVLDDKVFYTVHSLVPESRSEFEMPRILERLKRLIM